MKYFGCINSTIDLFKQNTLKHLWLSITLMKHLNQFFFILWDPGHMRCKVCCKGYLNGADLQHFYLKQYSNKIERITQDQKPRKLNWNMTTSNWIPGFLYSRDPSQKKMSFMSMHENSNSVFINVNSLRVLLRILLITFFWNWVVELDNVELNYKSVDAVLHQRWSPVIWQSNQLFLTRNWLLIWPIFKFVGLVCHRFGWLRNKFCVFSM